MASSQRTKTAFALDERQLEAAITPPARAAEPALLLQVHVGIGRRPSGRWTAQNCCPVKLVRLPDSPKLDFVSLEPATVDLSSGGVPDYCAAVFKKKPSKTTAQLNKGHIVSRPRKRGEQS